MNSKELDPPDTADTLTEGLANRHLCFYGPRPELSAAATVWLPLRLRDRPGGVGADHCSLPVPIQQPVPRAQLATAGSRDVYLRGSVPQGPEGSRRDITGFPFTERLVSNQELSCQ